MQICLINLIGLAKSISSAGTAGENGSGLGLVIVRQLITTCNGLLTIHTVPGLGITFKMVIPVSNPAYIV